MEKKGRIKLILYVVVFALMLALPIVTMNRIPGRLSETENRYLAKFPTVFDSEGRLADGLKDGFETWLGDNLGFRSEFMKLAANIKLKLLHQSTSEQVEIGRDGWYFYTPNDNLRIAEGTYPCFDESVLNTICHIQEMTRDKLAAQGIDYVLVLPPSKVSIYPEYIASGEYEVTRTPVDMLADYLEENSDIKVVCLKEPLLEAKKDQQVYFKTDTHWNEYGAYIGCSKIITGIKNWGITSSDVPQVSFDKGTHRGEFSAMLGDADILGLEECPKSVIVNATATRVADGEKYTALMQAVNDANILKPVYYYENPQGDEVTALFFGDSMFDSWNATELLAEAFSEFTYVRDYSIRQNIINAVQPDVVFYEMTERYLNSTMIVDTLSFIEEPLSDFEAEILDCEIGRNSVTVTVRNTSQAEWSYENGIGMAVFCNGVDSKRASLPLGRTVYPGETVTLEFKDVDINSLRSSHAELQMLQDGVTYFGEREVIED